MTDEDKWIWLLSASICFPASPKMVTLIVSDSLKLVGGWSTKSGHLWSARPRTLKRRAMNLTWVVRIRLFKKQWKIQVKYTVYVWSIFVIAKYVHIRHIRKCSLLLGQLGGFLVARNVKADQSLIHRIIDGHRRAWSLVVSWTSWTSWTWKSRTCKNIQEQQVWQLADHFIIRKIWKIHDVF